MNEFPPSAVLVGFAGDLDSSLIAYAEKHGLRRYDDVIDGGVIYVREEGTSNPETR